MKNAENLHEIRCFRDFRIYDFLHPLGANSNAKIFAKKAVFISLSALFYNLNFTDSGESKGCGGIMRVAPIGLLSKDKAESLCSQNNLRKEINSDDKETGSLEYVDMLAAEASAITHSHPLGYMSSAVFAHIIYRIVNNVSDLSLKQIIIEARDTAAKLFAGDMYLKELTDIIDLALELSENNDKDLDNIHRLGEGWVAEETLVIALYCSLRYQNDFSSGIIASVNHKGDSDSTGAVTGNILGAICGYDAIEQKWKNDLELLGVILRVADEISD